MIIFMACIILAAAAHFVSAEEELFDTKAASASLEKGIVQLRAKNYNSAVTQLEESVSIAPDAEAYYYLGYAYYMKGRAGDSESRKKSIESFEKAYELNPNFTPTRYKPTEASISRPEGEKIETQETVISTTSKSAPEAEEQPLPSTESKEQKD